MEATGNIVALCGYKTESEAVSEGLLRLGVERIHVEILPLEDSHAGRKIHNILIFKKDAVSEQEPLPPNILETLIQIHFSTDEMSCSITAPANPLLQQNLTLKSFVEFLKFKKVLIGLNGDAVVESYIKMRNGDSIDRLVLATGIAAIEGRAEGMIWEVNLEVTGGKLNAATGTIDLKERDVIKTVDKGQVIAKKIYATPGVNGLTVKGVVLLPPIREAKSVGAGQNIEVIKEKDGEIFKATSDGCPSIKNGRLCVDPLTVIPGNVDYSTGNIKVKGPLKILGCVLPGFVVDVDGDVMIMGNVEAATVRATGNITIALGIKGQDKACVSAGKILKAVYAEAATLESGSDMIIDNSLLNSHVLCDGKLSVCKKTGVIIGGRILAALGVEAKNIGSISNLATFIETGKDVKTAKALQKIQEDLVVIQKQKDLLERSFTREALEMVDCLNPIGQNLASQPGLERNHKVWKEAKAEIHRLEQERLKLYKDLVKTQAGIQVHDTVHCGVHLVIGIQEFHIQTEVKNRLFVQEKDEER